MSGILDSKSRIIDAIVTSEGRRQMSEGTFYVSYVTFSDGEVQYVVDNDEGHVDPTKKIYFESTSLPQDQIIFESNDSGKVEALRNQTPLITSPGQSVFSSQAQGVLKDGKLSVIENFHGRKIRVDDIKEVQSDLDKGFIYSDANGTTGSILINPSLFAGNVSINGATNTAHIGTKYGMGAVQFASVISSSITQLSILPAGPKVEVNSQQNIVFLDAHPDMLHDKSQLKYVGNLSSPVSLEQFVEGGIRSTDQLSGQLFASQVTGILSSSFDNFKKLRAISTVDKLFNDDSFVISNEEVTFDISKLDSVTVKSLVASPPTVNSIDSLFNDEKFSHVDNFSYLPPIVKVSDNLVPDKTDINAIKPYLLGDYPSWGDNESKLDYQTLMSNLSKYEEQFLRFDQTSFRNNVMMQIFEVNHDSISKLDVVDFGEMSTGINGDMTGDKRHVFFIGKVIVDNRGTPCFSNVFTLIFNRDRREQL